MTNKSDSTIAYYDANAQLFIDGTLNADMSQHYVAFLKYLKPGGHLLDAGCGSGRDSLYFKNLGYRVEAFDGSKEMVTFATTHAGIPVEHADFETATLTGSYDGIWANASLLHLESEALKRVLMRFKEALSAEGVLYMSFKHGIETYEKDGRWFYNQTAETIEQLVEELRGMRVAEVYVTTDVRPGRVGEEWVNVVVKRMKWIYKNSLDDTARFVLGEVGDGKPLICFGVNPSTASPLKLDTTISKLRKFSKVLGYDGWIMLNLYPQRATDPKKMHIKAKDEFTKENLKCIKQIIEEYQPTHIWASWGELLECRDYLIVNLKEISDVCLESKVNFMHLGELTKKGHPRHPSRLAYASKICDFDIRNYINNFTRAN